jgi:hypothetical protein
MWPRNGFPLCLPKTPVETPTLPQIFFAPALPRPPARVALRFRLLAQVVLETDILNDAELGLQEIDVVFLVQEQFL